MKINLTIVVVILLTAFAVYSIMDKRNSDAQIVKLQGENEQIIVKYDSLKVSVEDLIKRIEKINKTKEIIRKVYNEVANKIDDINSRDSVIIIIRRLFSRLVEPKFN